MPDKDKKLRISESKSDAMTITLSAIAEAVNSRYKGRAFDLLSADIADMVNDWRARLRAALAKSGKSMRAVSLAAKCSPGYIFDLLEAGKEPTVERLMRIADELGVSLSSILYGFELGKDEQELLTLFAKLTPKKQQAFLDLARQDNPGLQETHS